MAVVSVLSTEHIAVAHMVHHTVHHMVEAHMVAMAMHTNSSRYFIEHFVFFFG